MTYLQLLAITLLSTGSLACSTKIHEEFCSNERPCEGEQVCVESICVAETLEPQPDAAVDLPDAQPVCPETHECLAAAPAGWTGPAIRSEIGAEDTPEICPDAFSLSPGPLFSGITADGSCSCECGTPSSLSCTAATIEGRNSGTSLLSCYALCSVGGCPSIDLAPVSLPLAANSCTNITEIASFVTLKVTPGRVGTANCGAGVPVDNLNLPSFSEQTSLCAVTADQLVAGCKVGDVCAPMLESQQASCIYKEGEHSCPADGPYSVAYKVFEDINDKRSCAASCECDLAAGSACGRVSVSANSCFNNTALTGGCHTMPAKDTTAMAHFYADPADHNCSVVGDTEVLGEAEGTDDITICCLPE